jgi:hypothetical protein
MLPMVPHNFIGYAILEFPDEDDCICLVTVGKLKIEKEGGQHKEVGIDVLYS